jgi:DNA-binding CsgD family transcriptional regulator
MDSVKTIDKRELTEAVKTAIEEIVYEKKEFISELLRKILLVLPPLYRNDNTYGDFLNSVFPDGKTTLQPDDSHRAFLQDLDATDVVKSLVQDFALQYKLSSREMEVLVLAARGMISKEMAALLNLSTKTIDSYWSRIYSKTGIRSQRELLSSLLVKANHEK